jgi:preprotein translocase SecE subunit
MARDRQRAKQRRDQRERQARRSSAPRAERPADAEPARNYDPPEEPSTPEAIEHASAEVDQVEAAMAAGSEVEPDGATASPDGDDLPASELVPVDLPSGEELSPDGELLSQEDEDDDEPFFDGEDDLAPGDGARGDRAVATAEPIAMARSSGAGVEVESPGSRGANRTLAFLQASWRELHRVQWPDRPQLVQATTVVLVFCLLAGVFLGVSDTVSNHLVDAILSI